MTTKAELQERMESAYRKTELIRARALAGGRDFTPPECTELDAAFDDFSAAEKELEQLDAGPYAGHWPAHRAAYLRKTEPDNPADRDGHIARSAFRPRQIEHDGPHPTAGKTYAAMFGEPRDDAGWRPGEFGRCIGLGLYDHRIKAASTIGDDATGGYTVPAPIAADIFDRSLQMEIIRPRARTYNMTSLTLGVASLDLVDRSGNRVAGLLGEWLGELGEGTRQTPAFAQCLLTANKLALFVQASIELVEDGVGFEEELRRAFSLGMAFNLDRSFLWGDGSGEPQGILDAGNTALVTVAADAGQAGATFTFSNARKMWARLSPGSHQRAVWIVSPEVLPEIAQLHVLFKNAAGSENVGGALAPTVSQSADGTYSILGRPVLVSEHMYPLGMQGDVLLADLDAYAVGLRREMVLERAVEPGWTTFAIDFRARVRIAGKPLLTAAIKPPEIGSPSVRDALSPFVTLATRGVS